jgi:hypothetical protein
MIRRYLGSMAIVVGLVAASPVSLVFASHAADRDDHGHRDPCKDKVTKTACGAPEAPLPIGLPLVGLIVVGGFAYMVRQQPRLAV